MSIFSFRSFRSASPHSPDAHDMNSRVLKSVLGNSSLAKKVYASTSRSSSRQIGTRLSMRELIDLKVYRSIQGFSLIELLVVISIMSILMALAAVSYTTAQQRGRDAKRRADMSNIQKGFEQYFATNNTYDAVAGCTTMGASTAQFPAGLPSDPRNVAPYTYSYRCSATAYCACARLEATNSGNSTAAAAAVTCSFATSGATNWFCVTNLQ